MAHLIRLPSPAQSAHYAVTDAPMLTPRRGPAFVPGHVAVDYSDGNWIGVTLRGWVAAPGGGRRIVSASYIPWNRGEIPDWAAAVLEDGGA